MTKSDLLKNIAELGYDVGYGAKKHFATYDCASTIPGFITFSTFAAGVFFLLFDFQAKKYFAALFIVLGTLGWRVNLWSVDKEKYEQVGKQLTVLFNEVRLLYYDVKASDGDKLGSSESRLRELRNKYVDMGISKQMLFSDWYAHYKFFCQQQVGWIDEQLNFRLFRDKIPLSFSVSVMCVLFGLIVLCATWVFVPLKT